MSTFNITIRILYILIIFVCFIIGMNLIPKIG